MFDSLLVLGYGIVTFAGIIGVGSIILNKFGGSVAICNDVGSDSYVYNSTIDKCSNSSGGADTPDPTGSGWVNTNYMSGQLGQSGIAGWTPAVIAFSIGMMFLGYFLIRRGKARTY
jgi:hypothetical protein